MGSKAIKRLHEGDYCIECGGIATDTHHCLSGSRRSLAEEDGLTVRLCRNCHYKLHNIDERMALKYRKLAQVAYEYKHSTEAFRERYGKNYV